MAIQFFISTDIEEINNILKKTNVIFINLKINNWLFITKYILTYEYKKKENKNKIGFKT
jgi:hypothetical protein